MHYDIIITILYNNKNCLIFIIIFCTIPKMFNFVLIICHTISKIHTISRFIECQKLSQLPPYNMSHNIKMFHNFYSQIISYNIKNLSTLSSQYQKFCLNFIIVQHTISENACYINIDYLCYFRFFLHIHELSLLIFSDLCVILNQSIYIHMLFTIVNIIHFCLCLIFVHAVMSVFQ